MNDEQFNADDLSDFVDRLHAGREETPASPEAQTAADLHHLASRIVPSANLMQRALPPLQSNGQLKRPKPNLHEDYPMTTIAHDLPGQRPTRRLTIPLTLAAAVAAVFLLLSVLLGLPNGQPTAAPIVVQASTPTPAQLLKPTPTPTPGAVAAPPALPLPVGAYVADLSDETLAQLRAMGMEWVAVNLPFEIASGLDSLQLASMLISAVHAHDMRILLTVTGTKLDMMAHRETYTDDYASFIGTVAGLAPDAIQVWNEPNIDVNWIAGEIDAVAYVDLLTGAYEAIKAANPDVMVISAALAPTSAQSVMSEHVVNDDTYYTLMAQAGAAEAADCIGVHYVEGIVAPDTTSGDSRGESGTRYLTTMLERAAAPFRERGDVVPLCVTELGYISPEGLPEEMSDPFAWANETSVDEQARWLAGSIVLMSELSSKQVELVIVFNYNSVSPAAYHHGYSMLRPDGSCPACDAIATLQQ
ncbi:MAG: hypothetical protein IT320_11985 [Anaerolineae bacterium]|nr:hypothetical protein [Anaerolineae bacterium]